MPKVIPLKNLTKKTLYYISCLSALKKLTLYLRFYFSLLLSLSLSFWYWKKRTEKYLKLFVLLKLWYPFIRIILFNRFELQDTLLYSYTTTDFILYITFGSTIFNETWMNYYVVVVICVYAIMRTNWNAFVISRMLMVAGISGEMSPVWRVMLGGGDYK